MKNVAFYSLPRPTQERFVAATQGTLAPVPLVTSPATSGPASRLFGAAAVAALCAGVLLAWGFGDLSSRWSLPGRAGEFAVGLAGAAALTCLLRGLVVHDRLVALPYVRGTYLFPAGVVVATTETLSVFPIAECVELQLDSSRLTLSFAGQDPFEFRSASEAVLSAAGRVLQKTQAQLKANVGSRDERTLAELDPLYTSDFPAPLSRPDPIRPRPRGVARLLTLGAAGAGFALGFELGGLRNLVSEQRVLAHALAADSVDTYQAYVQRGGNDSRVAQVLLPRAKLRQVTEKGSVEAIRVFANTHGAADIRSDIDRALTNALLSALNRARADGTLASLEAFKRRYPDHAAVAGPLRKARHSLFVEAADSFEARARPATRRRDVGKFFRALLHHSEHHGPRVEIRFRSQLGASVAEADRKVRSYRRGRYYRGVKALPSSQFRRRHLKPIEEAAALALQQGLQSLFPEGLLSFHIGGALDPLDADTTDRSLPEFDLPTLVVDYRVELSGRLFPTDQQRLFVGAGYFFDARCVLPGSTMQLRVRRSNWRKPAPQAMHATQLPPAQVYGDMTRAAFGHFIRRYLNTLVASPPKTRALARQTFAEAR